MRRPTADCNEPSRLLIGGAAATLGGTMSAIQEIPELEAVDSRRMLVRIPPETDVPMTPRVRALIDTAEYYLGLEGFSMEQVLESRIME